MTEGSVNFLMSGDGHAPYLVVALQTLRKHFQGRVIVHSYPECLGIMQRIGLDSSLGVEAVKLWMPVYRGKNGQFINKIVMMQQIDTDVGIYLDADLVIAGDITPLFKMVNGTGFVATQFNRWVTNSGTIKRRVSELKGRAEINQDAVNELLNRDCPSINGGVFACCRDSQILLDWYKATVANSDMFIADEVVLHSLTRQRDDITVATGGLWNCSPKYQPLGLKNSDVRIWHGHGDCFARPNKSQRGVNLWYPIFDQCRKNNIGGMRDWLWGTLDNNRHLKALEIENGRM